VQKSTYHEAMIADRTETYATEAVVAEDGELAIAQIGKYMVRRVVGTGGAGVVMAADDTELGRAVAIKLLRRDSEEARARLMREAKAMAQLSHPNVVTVYEVLRVGDRMAIVMALVEGRNLWEWRTAERTWREIVGVYVQAAHGLAAAHRAGLVHRDFKPANALIDGDGVVRVTDFGLVRASGERDDAAAPHDAAVELTQTGATLGTPAYMAPEQHTGGVVDARTDQWALACSLYGALYEQRPFAGESAAELAASAVAGVVRPEPADTQVPKRVRAAIRRALSREPSERFPSMRELIDALTQRKRAWVVGAIAGAAVAGSAITAFALAGSPSAGAACEGLDEPIAKVWNPGRAAAIRARLVAANVSNADRIIRDVDRYRDAWVSHRTTACQAARTGAASADLLDRRMGCLDRRLAEVDALTAELAVAEAPVAREASNAVANLHSIADCDDPRDTVPRPTDPRVRTDIARGEDAVAKAWALGDLGLFDKAMPLCHEAVAIAQRAGWLPLIARAQLQLSRGLSHANDGAGAVAAEDRAATAAANAHDDGLLAAALIAKAFDVGSVLGKPEEALAMKPYIELALQRAGNPPREKANWLHHLAAAHYNQHKWDEAFAVETEALELLRASVPPGNVAITDALALLSLLETERGNLDRASELAQQVLADDIAVRGPTHPSVASSELNIGLLDVRRGNLASALAHIERGAAIEKAAGIEHWTMPLNLGLVRRDLGQPHAAVPLLEGALAFASRNAGGDSVGVALTAGSLATTLIELGELDRAKPLLDRALSAARANATFAVREIHGELALYWLARGKPAEARAAIQAARAAGDDPSPAVELASAGLAARARDFAGARAAYQRAATAAAVDRSEAVTTLVTFGIAECDIATGRRADAVRALTERIRWLEAGGAEPAVLARAQQLLARARL